MQAVIITIGDEILDGQVIDTNSAWIAQQLTLENVNVVHIASIADREQAIVETLDHARSLGQLVIVTGGLGPTKDDITKATLSKYFKSPLVADAKVLAHVEGLFQRLGYATMPAINKHQADVLASCEVLFNDVGTAPGMWVDDAGVSFAFMPGVPFEMRFLMHERILPKVKSLAGTAIIHKAFVITAGIGESHLAEEIAAIVDDLPAHIKLAFLPRIGLVKLKFTASGTNPQVLKDELQKYTSAIVQHLGPLVISEKDQLLEEVILANFAQQGLTLATAESCTGGYIASMLTSISGSSSVFMGSAVTYSNAAKVKILGLRESTLASVGAVSEEAVREMAEGARKCFETDYAISTSGIAGPTGGTAEKPVGTVWIAIAGRKRTVAQKYQFKNDRKINIERSAAAALALLWKIYKEEESADLK